MNLNEVRHLVFKGGGAKGLAYLGALLELEKHRPLSQIHSFAGTSAGAITAMLLAFGKTTHQLTEIVTGIDWKSWLDEEWGYLRDLHNLRVEKGWCRSEVSKAWLREQVKQALGSETATFRDLQHQMRKSLVVVAYDVSRDIPIYFGWEDDTLDVPIADAVLASMSIPFLWEPVVIDGDEYCDGGYADNYPIHLWDLSGDILNMETLGFWADSPHRIQWAKTGKKPPSKGISKDFITYAQRVAGGAGVAEIVAHIQSGRDHRRTVYIDTPIDTLDLELSEEEIKGMIADGRRGFQEFVNRGNQRKLDLLNLDPRDGL